MSQRFPLLEKYASLTGRVTHLGKVITKTLRPGEYAQRVQAASARTGQIFTREAKQAVNSGTYADQYPRLMHRAMSRESRLDRFRVLSGKPSFTGNTGVARLQMA